MVVDNILIRTLSKLGARGAAGWALNKIGETKENLMVLTADLANTSGLDRFREAYPNKFLNCGIAEQNMINVAGGLAKEGFCVFASTFSNFCAMRSYEQIRLTLGYMKLNVKILGIGSGYAMSMFGNTHYGIEDAAIMRSIPNLKVLCPSDGLSIVKTIFAAAESIDPIYIRLTGIANNPIVYKTDFNFEIGKAMFLREGNDVALIANGTMVSESLLAAEILQQNGVNAMVIDMHTLKPLDIDAVNKALETNLIVTIEEHSKIGGLGGAVAEYIATKNAKKAQLFIGMADTFERAGDYNFLLNRAGLKSDKIAEKVMDKLKKDTLL